MWNTWRVPGHKGASAKTWIFQETQKIRSNFNVLHLKIKTRNHFRGFTQLYWIVKEAFKKGNHLPENFCISNGKFQKTLVSTEQELHNFFIFQLQKNKYLLSNYSLALLNRERSSKKSTICEKALVREGRLPKNRRN